MEGRIGVQNLEPIISSNIITDHSDWIASQLLVNRCYLDFERQNECGFATFPLSLQFQSSGNHLVSNAPTLQKILKPCLCDNQQQKSPEKLQTSFSTSGSSGNVFLSRDQIKSVDENDTLQLPSDERSDLNQDQSSGRQMQVAGFTCSSWATSGPTVSRKRRLRWNQDLHNKFVKCVNILGGAEKATPKAILKMMESKELTIFHIKSHLQKYRSDKYMSKCKQDDGEEPEKIISVCDMPQLYMEISSKQIKESQQLQVEAGRHLDELLKIQQKLELQIKENGRQLKMMMMMLDQQQRMDKNIFQIQKPAQLKI